MSAPEIAFGADGLVPAVAQDAATGEVLMLAWADREALDATLSTAKAYFRSRSRGRLWKKGEESGNEMAVREVRYDCDADALVYIVDPAGPACHTGARTCFFRVLGRAGPSGSPDAPPLALGFGVVGDVARVVEARARERPAGSYVAGLLARGPGAVREKITEEALETVQASKTLEAGGGTPEALAHEVADIWFHTIVLLAAHGVPPARVLDELGRRRR
jgi:phosphoribosyl-ATP pyrophosphohydrolase/phosphoribosyl-AMP cyclohydrolase